MTVLSRDVLNNVEPSYSDKMDVRLHTHSVEVTAANAYDTKICE